MAASLKPIGWQGTRADLDKRVSIYKPLPLADGFVSDTGEPELVADKRYAAILPAGGVEGSAGGGRQPGDRVIIVLPFEQALAEISTSWTVRNTRTGRRYNVLRADDTERHDRWIYLLCEYGKEGSNV